MRRIDYDKKLSTEDIDWLRQSGIPLAEERIRVNAEKFGVDVPEPETDDDTVTRGVVGEDAVGNQPEQPEPATGAVRKVDPADSTTSEPQDDYDSWSKSDLEAEVSARNALQGTTDVVVTGTGSNGNVTKPDLIEGLRAWDRENPDAIAPDEEDDDED